LRASEAQNLGFQKIVAPLNSKADGANIEIVGCETVRDALSFLGK
jgi:predicted ATP-dependent serine protease